MFFREIVLLGCKYSKNGTRILDKVKLHFWIDFILVQFGPKKTFFGTSNYPGNTNSITRVRVSSYYPGTRVLGYPLDALGLGIQLFYSLMVKALKFTFKLVNYTTNHHHFKLQSHL